MERERNPGYGCSSDEKKTNTLNGRTRMSSMLSETPRGPADFAGRRDQCPLDLSGADAVDRVDVHARQEQHFARHHKMQRAGREEADPNRLINIASSLSARSQK
jgi:hypothetical protein